MRFKIHPTLMILCRKAVAKHSVVLIAEEYPFKCQSRISTLAENMQIPYLQIDPLPEHWTALGIDREMRARQDHLMGQEIRLSNADSMRENFWLRKRCQRKRCQVVRRDKPACSRG